MIAKNCLDFQIENNFIYNIIPSRYFDELPIDYYGQYFDAVGPEAVLGILMPYKTSSKESIEHGLELVKSLGIKYRQIDISPMIDAYFEKITIEIRLRAGN